MTVRPAGDSWDDGEDDEGSDAFDGGYGLEAFDTYLPPQSPRAEVNPPEEPSEHDDDTVETLLCQAVNPAGSVAVTALLSGRIFRVELSPMASRMSENELAQEIKTTAALANLQARGAQHQVIATLLDRLGNDPAATRSMLEHELGLPSPETVATARAELFARQHTEDDLW